jgi:hypothetical protein
MVGFRRKRTLATLLEFRRRAFYGVELFDTVDGDVRAFPDATVDVGFVLRHAITETNWGSKPASRAIVSSPGE